MHPIKYDNLISDLGNWMAADAGAIDGVRRLRGGGWEQWCVLQFLRWQLTPGNRGDLDYRREYQPDGVSRRFDVTYNRKVIINDSDLVPIRTQWKCGNDGEKVTREVNHDLGTLATEMKMIADKTSSTGAL